MALCSSFLLKIIWFLDFIIWIFTSACEDSGIELQPQSKDFDWICWIFLETFDLSDIDLTAFLYTLKIFPFPLC